MAFGPDPDPLAAGAAVTSVYVAALSGAVPFEAVTVKVEVPGVVGVPEMTPVVPLRVSPAGRAPLEIV